MLEITPSAPQIQIYTPNFVTVIYTFPMPMLSRHAAAASLCALALLSCSNGGKTLPQSRHLEAEALPQVSFSADSAMAYVAAQTAFGPRVPETAAHGRCVDYLASTLRRLGAEVDIHEAEGTTYDGQPLRVRNIIGSYRPDRVNRVLLCAHYDSRPFADHDPDPSLRDTPISGANDGASGVGVLLEVARQLQARAPKVGVDIIFFDAEDGGTPDHKSVDYRSDTWCVGSQLWAKGPGRGAAHRFGILLDMVGDAGAVFPVELFSKRKAPDVVDKVWGMAEKMGRADLFPRVDGGYITDDHYYINNLTDVPVVDIIHYDGGFCKTWHTQQDVLENISSATLKAVGEVVLAVVYAEC